MPIAAGTSHGVCCPTGRALIDHDSQLAGLAGGDRVEHFFVLGGHLRTEALEIGRTIPPQHVGDGRHGFTRT